LASRKTRQYATPLFLSLHTFKLRSHSALLFSRTLLATLHRGVESLRGLEFAGFHWFPGVGAVTGGGRSDDVRLMMACKGLKWLGITLHVQSLMSGKRNAKGEVEPMGPEEIASKYDMEGVFGCGVLETVVLDACDQLHVFEESARDTEEVVEEFAEWMRGRFRRVGREVNIGGGDGFGGTAWCDLHFWEGGLGSVFCRTSLMALVSADAFRLLQEYSSL
ncbi:hypothetical protein BS50DRAFT_658450, partial [Corynespora cassiicola Philippines]